MKTILSSSVSIEIYRLIMNSSSNTPLGIRAARCGRSKSRKERKSGLRFYGVVA